MAVWQRHPRYCLLIFIALASTLYLLGPSGDTAPSLRGFSRNSHGRMSLERVMERSKRIYDKILQQREGLIKKHGPDPKDIALFPPDVAPWPPYTVWDFFPPAFNCPHEVERLGALGDGGKYVCGLSRVAKKKDCVVYSFGINGESSFEAEILSNTDHCQIYGYDFSVSSFGPEITQSLTHRTHFKAYGLAGNDSLVTIPPSAYTNNQPKEVPMYTLDTLMKMNGHKHIDILKIDIEGWEFDTLTSVVEGYVREGRELPFGQLQLEIHIWHRSFESFLGWWRMLENAGLRPFWTEPNLIYQNYNKNGHTADLAEYSFLNIKGNNVFISDRHYTPVEDEED